MKLGIRSKLFGLTLLPILAIALASGGYLAHVLETRLEERIEAELWRDAGAAKLLLENAPCEPGSQTPEALATSLGRALGARVTIIAANGAVLGDSELDGAAVERLENHAHRPEVARALAGEQGSSRRYSTTLRTEMLYVALPYTGLDESHGVVRIATPLWALAKARGQLRLMLVIAGVVGLGLAIVISALSSHMLSRTLRELVASAHAIARGEGSKRLSVTSADEIGRLAGSFNRLADELDRTVQALAGERDRLQTILEGMSDAVLALDAEGHIVLVNRAAMELLRLGASPEGRTLLETVRAPELAELVGGETPATEPQEIDLPGPPARRIAAHAAPLHATRGTVIVMHDVTEMRRLETIRRDFVANVSHELRTPVAIIRANAETLLDGALDDPPQAHTFVEASLRHAERLTHLIDDLLDLSRIEAGRYSIDLEPQPLLPIVQRAAQALEPAATDKQQTLALEVGDEIEVLADGRALEQVVFNLLDNAIKYTQAGGSIRARAHKVGARIRLEVEDDGPGIAAAHRARVFERFYRVDPGRSREMGGTGLGLAIVKHLADAMHASVGVEAAQARGTRFWISLETPTGVRS